MINYQELKKIGLSDKEAKLYLTSLQRGPETAPTLAKLSDIVRPTAYVIIDSLTKKGLMSSTAKGKKTFYTAESPEHLLSLIRLQKREIEEKEREIFKLIPQLELLANIKGEKPKVRVFEGKEGLKAVIESILKSKTKIIYSFMPADRLFDLFPADEHKEFMASPRVKKGIKGKLLYTSKNGHIYKAKDPQNLREATFIDQKDFPFDCGIDIYDDNIAFYTYKGAIMGVVIENTDIANTMKTVFNMIWEKYNRK
ncbi:MAG: helix-turn-helix domain-containing protein [Patescibacteria group bacterium]